MYAQLEREMGALSLVENLCHCYGTPFDSNICFVLLMTILSVRFNVLRQDVPVCNEHPSIFTCIHRLLRMTILTVIISILNS